MAAGRVGRVTGIGESRGEARPDRDRVSPRRRPRRDLEVHGSPSGREILERRPSVSDGDEVAGAETERSLADSDGPRRGARRRRARRRGEVNRRIDGREIGKDFSRPHYPPLMKGGRVLEADILPGRVGRRYSYLAARSDREGEVSRPRRREAAKGLGRPVGE
ncbi:hypothetical protein D3C86_1730140 [compost metagenome]